MSGQLILVTGASGHLGFRVMVEALEAGYRVRAPVRRTEQIATIKAAPSLKNYLDKVEIIIVPDILAEGAYDEALIGVTGVIHCASPLAGKTSGSDFEREMIAPAIQGTMGILNSALKVPTIKRFAITSSCVATIPWEEIGLIQSGRVFTDKDTAPVSQGPYSNYFEAYSASKALTRLATDDFVANKHPKFGIVNIMPSFIIGKNELASFENIEHGTNAFALAPLRGYSRPPAVGVTVYINDVARVHVKALDPTILPDNEKPIYDSFMVSSGGLDGTNFDDAIEIYKKYFDGQVSKELFPLTGTQPTKPFKLDSERTEKVFGLKFADYETQVKSVVEHYVELAKAVGV